MAKRDYRAEYDKYQGTDEQKKNRAKRNAARRQLAKEGRVSKGDGMDVDHKKPLSKGGSTAAGNLRAVSKTVNRSFPRTKTGAMKTKKS
jgi:5-methylcytosine-specific restriction endonuclease McrA